MKRLLLIATVGWMLALPLAAQPAHEGGKEAAEHEDSGMIWKVVNFVVLAGGLGWLIAKKGGVFFASRTAEIRKGIEDAAREKKDADARYAQMEQRLASLGAEIEALRQQAIGESAAEGERIREETAVSLKKVQAQAEQEIESAAKTARQELREYAAELAVRLAEKHIRERMTPDTDAALLGGMLQDLEKRSAVRPS